MAAAAIMLCRFSSEMLQIKDFHLNKERKKAYECHFFPELYGSLGQVAFAINHFAGGADSFIA